MLIILWKLCKRVSPRGKFVGKIPNFDCVPTFLPRYQISCLSGQYVAPLGQKPIFGPDPFLDHWVSAIDCNGMQKGQTSILSNSFTCSQPFNEMFIFSGKSRCCSDTFAVYIAASKEYLTRRQIIFRCLESTFWSAGVLKLCSNWLILLRVILENKGDVGVLQN